MKTLHAFQDLSFGTLLAGAMSTITAAVTFITAGGGLPKDFSSVRFALFNVFRASVAAFGGGGGGGGERTCIWIIVSLLLCLLS